MKKPTSGTVVPFRRPASQKVVHLPVIEEQLPVAASPHAEPIPEPSAPAKPIALTPILKRAKRITATLTGVPDTSRSKKEDGLLVGSGVLTIANKEFSHADPLVLGTAAAIAGVTNVLLKTKGLPAEGLKLHRRAWSPLELDTLESSVSLFFKQFHTGFDIAKNSKKCIRFLVDRCQDEHWTPAWEMLPPEMRVLRGLQRGVYDDDGRPMSGRRIASQARSKGFLDRFASSLGDAQEFESQIDIVLAGTTEFLPSDEGGEAPIVCNNEALTVLRALVAKFEFGHLPLTKPQLDAFILHVDKKISDKHGMTAGMPGDEITGST